MLQNKYWITGFLCANHQLNYLKLAADRYCTWYHSFFVDTYMQCSTPDSGMQRSLFVLDYPDSSVMERFRESQTFLLRNHVRRAVTVTSVLNLLSSRGIIGRVLNLSNL